MPHYGPQPVGLAINNNQGGSEASRSGPAASAPNDAAEVASKVKEAFHSTSELVGVGKLEALPEANESTDFLSDMTKEQLREFIVSNGGNLDGFNARTGKEDILSRAKQVARR